MNHLIQQVVDQPIGSIFIILNLILIESLLSVDNAAVLATMVRDLPKEEQKKALKYGILGAYIFRGLALIFANFLIKIWWLKSIGGLYLIYLVYAWYQAKHRETQETELPEKESHLIYRYTLGKLGKFWSTILLVEIMDMAFSIDNVFAAVAYSDNIILVCLGVFIGIVAMRYITQWFVSILDKYPILETSAFIVVFILGLKLLLSVFTHLFPLAKLSIIINHNSSELILSIFTVLVFIVPVVYSKLNPKR